MERLYSDLSVPTVARLGLTETVFHRHGLALDSTDGQLALESMALIDQIIVDHHDRKRKREEERRERQADIRGR